MEIFMGVPVRLADKEIKIIKETFLRHFGTKDHLWLFGSRADLNKRGGDIDFFIETYCDNLSEIADKKIKFLVDLKQEIGEQKIDIIIRMMASQNTLPIHEEAKRTGVQLV